MRLVIGLLIFFLCIYLGNQKALPIKKRKEFYISFNNFNLLYKNAVAFEKKTLFQIVETNRRKDDFYELLDTYLQTGKVDLNSTYFSNDEKMFLTEYLQVTQKVLMWLRKLRYIKSNNEPAYIQ